MSLTQAGSRVSCVGSVKMDLQFPFFQFCRLKFEDWFALQMSFLPDK